MDFSRFEEFSRENELMTIKTVNDRPALQLPGDDRPLGEFAHDIGDILKGQNIFSRKGSAFTVAADGQRFEPVNPTWLRSWAEKHVYCFKVRQLHGNEFRPVSSMSEDHARAVIQAPQFLEQLRPVERFHPCRMPVLRESGAIELLPTGYDRESMTFTANGAEYDLEMSTAEAHRILKGALAEFPFTADGGRSMAVAIGAMLTVYAGGLMPTGSLRPLFLYLCNAEGGGKTTLAKLAGAPYGAIAADTAPKEEAEWQKKLLATVMSGRRVVLLDNLKGFLNSPSLEAYTTSSLFGGRILGVSKEFSGEACATVLVTGNGLKISQDMRRRSLAIELFMSELRAEDRTFKRRLDDPAIIELRPRLLAAYWALVRAWDASGRPGASRVNSSFPRWCETIGGIVELAGFACPTAPAELEAAGDTDTRDVARLAELMEPGKGYTFEGFVELCDEHGLFERFTEAADEDGNLDHKARSAFPKMLAKYDRRVIADGVRFMVEGQRKTRRYSIQTETGRAISEKMG